MKTKHLDGIVLQELGWKESLSSTYPAAAAAASHFTWTEKCGLYSDSGKLSVALGMGWGEQNTGCTSQSGSGKAAHAARVTGEWLQEHVSAFLQGNSPGIKAFITLESEQI